MYLVKCDNIIGEKIFVRYNNRDEIIGDNLIGQSQRIRWNVILTLGHLQGNEVKNLDSSLRRRHAARLSHRPGILREADNHLGQPRANNRKFLKNRPAFVFVRRLVQILLGPKKIYFRNLLNER